MGLAIQSPTVFRQSWVIFMVNRNQPAGLSRRALLAAVPAMLLPGSLRTAQAATWSWQFYANVNFQGLEGGSVVPGVEGTNYFAASAADLRYVALRSNGASRLPFLWERLQPTIGGPLDQTYLSQIISVANAAASVGRTIFLDCHNYMHRKVNGVDRYVDNPDGVLTRAHLADLWTKIAQACLSNPGVSGYDIMNEPQGPFGARGYSADLAAIMQASVDAIGTVDSTRAIFIEGKAWSSAANWVTNNPSYPLVDRFDRLVYSAHCYPDYDASGTHFDYASQVSHNIPTTVLVDRTTGFAQWCKKNQVRGHIGETNVGIDDTRWLAVLDAGLAFWKSQNIPVNLWMYGANFGSNPYNLYPYAIAEPWQWSVIRKYI